MQSFSVLRDKFHKILSKKIAIVNSSLKIDIKFKYLPRNHMLTKRSRKLSTIF